MYIFVIPNVTSKRHSPKRKENFNVKERFTRICAHKHTDGVKE